MTTSPAAHPAFGAYGLQLAGLTADPVALGLVAVPDDTAAPVVRVRCVLTEAERPSDHALDDARATLLLIEDEWATMERESGEIVFHTRREVSEPDLVHPYLAAPVGLVAQWHGRLAFHAGGVVVDGKAWAVLGDKGAGKTTTLAHLAMGGADVVADDLFVLEGDRVFAGPRCLDLRPASVEALDAPPPGVAVRHGERLRMPLRELSWSLSFGGCLVLEEGPDVVVRDVPAAERLRVLTPQWMWGEHDGIALLDVIARPMLVLQRPLRWDALPEALEALVEGLHQAGTDGGAA